MQGCGDFKSRRVHAHILVLVGAISWVKSDERKALECEFAKLDETRRA